MIYFNFKNKKNKINCKVVYYKNKEYRINGEYKCNLPCIIGNRKLIKNFKLDNPEFSGLLIRDDLDEICPVSFIVNVDNFNIPENWELVREYNKPVKNNPEDMILLKLLNMLNINIIDYNEISKIIYIKKNKTITSLGFKYIPKNLNLMYNFNVKENIKEYKILDSNTGNVIYKKEEN